MAENGLAILFLSHRLDEVVGVAHDVTVLRDGEVVGHLPGQEARVDKIAELMVGRKVERPALPPRDRDPSDDDLILEIRDLSVDMPGERLAGLDLKVRRGGSPLCLRIVEVLVYYWMSPLRITLLLPVLRFKIAS